MVRRSRRTGGAPDRRLGQRAERRLGSWRTGHDHPLERYLLVRRSQRTSVALSGVWARMPNDAWIGGAQGTILHWNGSAWSLVPVEVQ